MWMKFELRYGDKAKCQENWTQARETVPELPATPPDFLWGTNPYLDEAMAKNLVRLGFSLAVSDEQDAGTANTMLVKLQDKMESLGLRTTDLENALKNDCVVQVHIPDVGLLLIDEVDYMDDACTSQLQDCLNEGWRILAVCPPNAKRRPDYILGRRKGS